MLPTSTEIALDAYGFVETPPVATFNERAQLDVGASKATS